MGPVVHLCMPSLTLRLPDNFANRNPLPVCPPGCGGAGRLHALDHGGDALTAADAHRLQTIAGVATLHLV